MTNPLPDHWKRAEMVKRCAACNGPIYYPNDDARPYCHRVRMPAVVVLVASDEEGLRHA
jgi:hypothetical protein